MEKREAGHQVVAVIRMRTSTATALRILVGAPPGSRPAAVAVSGVLLMAPTTQTGTKKGLGLPRPLFRVSTGRLLERRVDLRELGVQGAAEGLDDGDDRKRNAGRDKAVFDGGGAGLILYETRNQIPH